MKIKVSTLDGKSYEFVASSFAGTADRVAFERRFQLNAAVMGTFFDDDGQPLKDVEGFRDEWMAFFIWRCLKRYDSSVPAYDDFIEEVDVIEMKDEEESKGKKSRSSTRTHTDAGERLAPVAQLGT